MRRKLILLFILLILVVLSICFQKNINYGGFIKIRFIDSGGHPVVGVAVDHHVLGYQAPQFNYLDINTSEQTPEQSLDIIREKLKV